MSADVNPPVETAPVTLEIPESRRGVAWRLVLGVFVAAACAGGYRAWSVGYRPAWMRERPALVLTTVPVDRGEMVGVVVENGSLESANNTAVKCQVEALVGLTGWQTGLGAVATPKNSSGGVSSTPPKETTRAAARIRAGAGGAKDQIKMAKGPGAGSSGVSLLTAAGVAPVDASTALSKPTVRSFSYAIPPYVILRPRISLAVAQKLGWIDPSMMMGGRGLMEKPGSTRVISIVDEGTRVKTGDILCELDSSKFREEMKAQQIRYLQAKSWVEQARLILDVNLITLREYQEGVYPQDVQLVHQYMVACKIEEERAHKNLEWSKLTAAQGYRSPNQVQADALVLQQAEFRLRDAEYMANRLEKYTAPRVITNLKAKIQAIKSDLLSQEAAFQQETDRLRRLEAAVANCTIRAPLGGIVVYHNPANTWGRVDAQIREGTTVREGQVLIDLPDPKHMQVRARINESKVSLIHTGQKVWVTIDAYPDHPMLGTVTEVTPIPSGANGPISDVQIYYAMVVLDEGGFEGLRPGLSAEVNFLVDVHRDVMRVPLAAIRWVDGKPFAAVVSGKADSSGTASAGSPAWEWRPLDLGETDREFAEVVSGLAPGERVVSRPDQLPAPRHAHSAPAVADQNAPPRG
jgi:HlyD family secretion protein